MLKEFRNLTEYQALCLAERLDSAAAEAVLDGLRLEKLCAVLGSFALLTRLRVNRWLKELSKASPVAVTLRLESEEITPYMQESGVLCFGKKDLSRKEKLFMLLAHESAHFLLMAREPLLPKHMLTERTSLMRSRTAELWLFVLRSLTERTLSVFLTILWVRFRLLMASFAE